MEYAEFSGKLKDLKLSKEEFSKIVGMHYHSVANWKANGIPAWVEPFLTYYEKAQDLEKIFKILEKHRRV